MNQHDVPDAATGVVSRCFRHLLGMTDAMQSRRQQKSGTQRFSDRFSNSHESSFDLFIFIACVGC
jgi:hypothetical protein